MVCDSHTFTLKSLQTRGLHRLLFLLPPPSPLSLAALAGILGGAGWYSGPLGFLVAHGLGGPPHVLLMGVVNIDFGRRHRS